MQCVFTSILLVLLLQPIFYEAYLDHVTRGNLVEDFRFNFTLYLSSFNGTIFYSVDHESNILSLHADQNRKLKYRMQFTYNNERRYLMMKRICGCDPCHDRMMNLNIRSNKLFVFLSCNKLPERNINKTKNTEGKKVKIDESISVLLNSSNTLYMSIPVTTPGCVQTFHFNDTKVYLEQKDSNFMLKCPRSCPTGICNHGRCRALYREGPTCDCSVTSRNGDFCKNDLKAYKPNTNHSYYIEHTDGYFFFKVSWNTLYTEQLCLLELIYGRKTVLYTLQGLVLLKYSKRISNLTKENFLTITLSNKMINIKVNDKIIERYSRAPGRIIIKVGSGYSAGICSEYKGLYDIDFRKYDIYEDTSLNTSPSTTDSNTSFGTTLGIEREISFHILIGILAAMILFFVIFLVIHLCQRRSGKKSSNENVVYNNKKEKSSFDNSSKYDSLEFPKIDGEKEEKNVYDGNEYTPIEEKTKENYYGDSTQENFKEPFQDCNRDDKSGTIPESVNVYDSNI